MTLTLHSISHHMNESSSTTRNLSKYFSHKCMFYYTRHVNKTIIHDLFVTLKSFKLLQF